MTSPIHGIQNRQPPACDTTPPPALRVAAEFGDLVPIAGARDRVDPLVFQFGSVEPGTLIQFLNRSAKPDASWSSECDRQSLPVGDNAQGLPRGLLTVALTDEAAEGLGIRPGDTLEFRQVDAAGNASTPTLVRLNQRTPNSLTGPSGILRWQGLRDADRFELGGTNLQRGAQYDLVRHADGRPPVVVPGRMAWSTGPSSGDRWLSGERAIEPDATVRLQNQRTRRTFEARADDEGRFHLQFEADCGDPLDVSVIDRHGETTHLGLDHVGFPASPSSD